MDMGAKARHTAETRGKRILWQKTCHIFTVNLGHIDTISDEMSEDEIIEELELHWADLISLPNVKLARGQIERNENGNLHINGGVKFSKVVRSSTLMNRWSCWSDPADNEEAVMNYGKKTETRVKALENFGVKKARKELGQSPKEIAIDLLIAGLTPAQICGMHPKVYFTHHRAILETFKMMQWSKKHGMDFGEEE